MFSVAAVEGGEISETFSDWRVKIFRGAIRKVFMMFAFYNKQIRLVHAWAVACVPVAVLWLSVGTADAQAKLTVIPRPASVEEREGTFALRANTAIIYAEDDKTEAAKTARYLADMLSPLTNLQLKVSQTPGTGTPRGSILFTRKKSPESLGDEGYILDISPERVVVRANKAAGMFYAVQTLRQLLSKATAKGKDVAGSARVLPCVLIEDRPRFCWRGMMLDPARQFLATDFLKRYIDILASYKLNRLHLHLTDHTGWTVEIKKYPQLTDTSRWPIRSADRKAGVYTQDDLRELVAYATARHVIIVPEIEIIGHNSVPGWLMTKELLCPNNPYYTHEKPWDGEETIPWMEPCAARPETLEIYKNILREVIDIFPSPYLHIGGDEYFGNAWEKCPECQKLIETKNLRKDDSDELKQLFGKDAILGSKEKYLVYRYLMVRICDFVRSQGRRPMLWDDLAWRGKFPQDAVVMQWHFKGSYDFMQKVLTPEHPAAEAARAGHDAVAVPYNLLYFDKASSANSSLEGIYRLDPVPAGLTPEQKPLILGPHAAIWSHRQAEIHPQTFPRLYALAEIGWTPGQIRDSQEFARRVDTHEKQRAAMPQSTRPRASGQ